MVKKLLMRKPLLRRIAPKRLSGCEKWKLCEMSV